MFLTANNVTDHKEAIIDVLGNRVSYGMLREDCEHLKSFLSQRSCFVILADRKIDTVRLYYATMANRHIVLQLNPESDSDFIQKYISLYRPQYIWIKDDGDRYIKNTWQCLYRNKEHLLYKTDYPVYDMNPELALLLTTSGSTGNPKTVRLSYTNIYDNADAFVDALELKSSDRGLLTLPIYYTYGLAVCHMHFIIGATLLITEKKPFDSSLIEFLQKEQLTDMHGVPYAYSVLEQSGMLYRLPSSLRLLTMGGGRAEKSLHDTMNTYFEQNNVRVNALYGQTEGTTILTKIYSKDKWNVPGCIGVPCKGMEAFIDSENDELCFRGSSVCMGYALSWKDLCKPDENHGLLRTGDTARMDSDGRIFLTGRLKRIVKLHGIRINLDDIECAVEEKYGISCACCGEENQLKVFLMNLKLPIGVNEWIAKRFKFSRATIYCYAIDDFPRTSNQKVDYQALNHINK